MIRGKGDAEPHARCGQTARLPSRQRSAAAGRRARACRPDAPSACPQLVRMASECSWADPVVELQALMRLTNFAYMTHDHEVAMACSQKAIRMGIGLLRPTSP